jgi:Cytochrome c oxidase caa3 assembly factor (Caa3_CtaG)
MACCAVAAWLLGFLLRPLATLFGRSQGHTWPPSARWPPGTVGTTSSTASMPPPSSSRLFGALVVAAGVELVAGFWLARWWADIASATTNHSPTHHPATRNAQSSYAAVYLGDGLVIVAAVLVVGLVAIALRRAVINRTAAWALTASCFAAAVALSPTVCILTATSHLAAMAQLEVVSVAIPIVLVRTASPLIRTRTKTEAPILSATTLAVALLAYPGLILVVHLPKYHTTITRSPNTFALLLTVIALCAIAMWSVALSPVLPYTPSARLAAVVWTLEIVSLIGLALILAPRPIYSHLTGLGALDPLTDQRLAGALMMAVELGVAVPIIKSLTHASQPLRIPSVRVLRR